MVRVCHLGLNRLLLAATDDAGISTDDSRDADVDCAGRDLTLVRCHNLHDLVFAGQDDRRSRFRDQR